MAGIDELDRTISEKNIPFSATFELTYGCNLKCSMCYQFPFRKGELNTQEVKGIIDQLADAGCLYLSLTGGEPLMRRDIWDIVEHARQRTFAVTLQTNATLIGPAEADTMRALDVMDAHISVLGATDSTHDKITGVSGSFRKAMRAAELLIARKIKVFFKTTVMKGNYSEYKEIWKLAESMGALPYFSPMIFPRSDGAGSPLRSRLSDDQLKELFSFVFSSDAEKIGLCTSQEPVAICRMGRTECAINPRGDVYPCVSLPLTVGNLRNESFAEIWRSSAELKKIRAISSADLKQCPECSLASDCLRCPGLSYLEHGDILSAPAECCRMTKTMKEVKTYEQEKVLQAVR
ncbi:MAG: radical SAM protein [Candidatus Omnitrophica bacterium]|nr:radical SAM protein [Candidatus Omnitrophota bacterium]